MYRYREPKEEYREFSDVPTVKTMLYSIGLALLFMGVLLYFLM